MSGIRTKWLSAAALTFAIAGCSTHTIKYRNASVAGGGQVHAQRQSYFLWGLVGGDQLELDTLCPSGVSRIESTNSFGDQLFTLFTGGLYSPLSVEIECSGGATARIDGVPADAAARLVATARSDR